LLCADATAYCDEKYIEKKKEVKERERERERMKKKREEKSVENYKDKVLH
jgi:hypothetical protein